MTDVALGLGITDIYSKTFYGCLNLSEIIIPHEVEEIGDSAFVNCTKLARITIPRKTATIASNAFSYPKKMTIYGPSGSYAQTYAEQKGIAFVAQNIAATSAVLNMTSKIVEPYEDFQLSVTIMPQNFTDEIVWSSSDENVAKVSQNGYVDVYKEGTAVIMVKVGSLSASCTVIVADNNSGDNDNHGNTGNNGSNSNSGNNSGNNNNGNTIGNTNTAGSKFTVKKAAITSAKNSKKKQIIVKYKKVSGAKGYEISYSTNKKFKKSVIKKTTKKTTYTIKKLKKGKTYYVRVRAYKIDSTGKKVYGKYSAVKKVKVKK